VTQATEIADRLARLYAGEPIKSGTDAELEDEPTTVPLSGGERFAEPASVPRSVTSTIDGLLDELERGRALAARGFDEESIRAHLLRDGVWNALRFTLYDGASSQVDEVRRRAKNLFPHVSFGNGRIARELVHIVKIVDRDCNELSPAQRPRPMVDGRFTDAVESAIAERRDRALSRVPLGDHDQEVSDAEEATRARTQAEDQVHQFTDRHGIAEPDPELFTLLAAAVWRGYNLELGGRDDDGRPWIHLWRGRSSTARIDRGAALVLTEAMGQTHLVLARRTDADATREGADEPTSRPETVVTWLGLARAV